MRTHANSVGQMANWTQRMQMGTASAMPRKFRVAPTRRHAITTAGPRRIRTTASARTRQAAKPVPAQPTGPVSSSKTMMTTTVSAMAMRLLAVWMPLRAISTRMQPTRLLVFIRTRPVKRVLANRMEPVWFLEMMTMVMGFATQMKSSDAPKTWLATMP